MTPHRLLLAMALAVAVNAHAGTADPGPPPGAANAESGAPIPFKRDTESTGERSGRVAAALLVVLAAGAAAIMVVRRRWAPGLAAPKSRRLQLLEVQRVGVKSAVVLVRWDQEELLLAQGEGSMQLLARRDARRDTGDRT
jgi:flagellar biogenesis protein FliO